MPASRLVENKAKRLDLCLGCNNTVPEIFIMSTWCTMYRISSKWKRNEVGNNCTLIDVLCGLYRGTLFPEQIALNMITFITYWEEGYIYSCCHFKLKRVRVSFVNLFQWLLNWSHLLVDATWNDANLSLDDRVTRFAVPSATRRENGGRLLGSLSGLVECVHRFCYCFCRLCCCCCGQKRSKPQQREREISAEEGYSGTFSSWRFCFYVNSLLEQRSEHEKDPFCISHSCGLSSINLYRICGRMFSFRVRAKEGQRDVWNLGVFIV